MIEQRCVGMKKRRPAELQGGIGVGANDYITGVDFVGVCRTRWMSMPMGFVGENPPRMSVSKAQSTESPDETVLNRYKETMRDDHSLLAQMLRWQVPPLECQAAARHHEVYEVPP